MVTSLRPITDRDRAAVLALNEAGVELLAPMDDDRLEMLLGWADRADVVDVDGMVAGFVLTFPPGTAYDSQNYRWFAGEFGERFYYLDRIVLDPAFRRRGLGALVYDAVEADAAPYGRLVLEVNVDPPNEPSLAFHLSRGYAEIARLGGSGKQVALMEKPLHEE